MEKITLEQRFARALIIAAAGGAVAWAMMIPPGALPFDMSVIRCALGGAFRAGFFFSLATVLGGALAIFLLPLDDALASLQVWDSVDNSAFKPFAVTRLFGSIIDQDGAALIAWGGGLLACVCAMRNQRATSL